MLDLPEFDEHNRKNWTIERNKFICHQNEPDTFGSISGSESSMLGSAFYESLRKVNTSETITDEHYDY